MTLGVWKLPDTRGSVTLGGLEAWPHTTRKLLAGSYSWHYVGGLGHDFPGNSSVQAGKAIGYDHPRTAGQVDGQIQLLDPACTYVWDNHPTKTWNATRTFTAYLHESPNLPHVSSYVITNLPHLPVSCEVLLLTWPLQHLQVALSEWAAHYHIKLTIVEQRLGRESNMLLQVRFIQNTQTLFLYLQVTIFILMNF